MASSMKEEKGTMTEQSAEPNQLNPTEDLSLAQR